MVLHYDFDEAGAYDFMVDNDLDYGDLVRWDGVEDNWSDAVTNKNAPVTNVSLSATGGDENFFFLCIARL